MCATADAALTAGPFRLLPRRAEHAERRATRRYGAAVFVRSPCRCCALLGRSRLARRSDVEEGGETVFPAATDGTSPDKGALRACPGKADTLSLARRFAELSSCGQHGLAIKPRQGDALLFWSMTLDGNTVRGVHSTLHGLLCVCSSVTTAGLHEPARQLPGHSRREMDRRARVRCGAFTEPALTPASSDQVDAGRQDIGSIARDVLRDPTYVEQHA